MNTIVATSFASSVLLIAFAAHGGVQAYELGVDAPPDVIGGVPFTAFAPDSQPLGGGITSVAVDGSSPVSGLAIGFGAPVEHRMTPFDTDFVPWTWGTWSHGYVGDVYYTTGNEIAMLMPDDAQGFRFYLEPNSLGAFPFTVTAMTDAGSTVTVSDLVAGLSGAKGFAFLTTGGESLASITVSTVGDAVGFAVGEFGITMVPTPATLALLGVWGLCRRRQRLV